MGRGSRSNSRKSTGVVWGDCVGPCRRRSGFDIHTNVDAGETLQIAVVGTFRIRMGCCMGAMMTRRQALQVRMDGACSRPHAWRNHKGIRRITMIPPNNNHKYKY